MKTTLQLFLTCLGVLIVFNSNAQRGKEGNQIISAPNTVVNTYTNLTATAAAGTSTLTVANNAMTGGAFGGTALAPGDLVMVIQMQGAVLNCDTYPNDNAWGTYTIPAPYRWSNSWKHHAHEWGALIHLNIFGNPTNGYGNSGKFEEIEVLSVTGGTTIELGCDLTNTYDGTGHVQIVRIPRYDTLTISGTGSIVPNLWNGTTGGVVDIEVNSHLDINAGGLISADASGFRGGQLDDFGTSGSVAVLDDVKFLGTSDPAFGSEKGEGIHGHYAELDAIASRYGISGASNGGGGGGFQNCGGGGGSNVYAGGLRYTGTGVPNPIYNVNWALDLSYPDFNLDPQTYSNLVGRPSPGGGRGGYSLAEFDNNENVLGPREAAWGGDGRKPNGGRGGHPLVYDATRIYLGGGGGAGDQDSDQGGAGGTGGGIIHITTYGTFVGNGTISADGADGQKSNPGNLDPGFGSVRRGHDGAGGGGAGGSVLIENAAAIPASISILARGGDGGDQDMRLFQNPGLGINTSDEASGPGGSGGGGNIAFNSGAPTQDVTAGSAGTISTQDFEGGVYTTIPSMVSNHAVNGATDGYPGEPSLAAPYFDIVGTDTTICIGQSVDLTVSTLGTFLTGLGNADITWYTQQFCDPTTNIQGTGLTITVSPTVTTTYWVGICPGKWRIPVVVTVTPGATLVTTDPAALCLPATADISIPAITVGSDVGTLTYWQDNGMVTPIADETAVGAGWHYINLSLGGGCETLDSVFVIINPLDDATFATSDFCASSVNAVSGVVIPGGVYAITGQTGSGLVTINGATGVLSNFVTGDQVTIEYTTPTGGCQNTSSLVVNVLPADDATFVTADFCESAVNAISGVVMPGGTYVITGQTGSGLVTINGATGVLSNFVAGDQVTIQYTTPAGACQTSSSIVVNVTPADDASFTTSDFCISTVNAVSAVATPGGTYVITGQTGSGLATINGGTGVLANYVAGDQVTIQYTTPAGLCQNSSSQVVNITPLDDASFTTNDFCASAVNAISGVALPGGTYSITGQTGSGLATISGGTGILANFVAGDQITIQYTTPAGGCQNTSAQIINVLPNDDASFTTIDFCESSVNVISGVALPGGTYVITGQTGSGLVTINGATGVLANYVAGDQVTIEYTTPAGGCQNTSSQVVNVTSLDDASFTTIDFCVSSVNAISGVVVPGGTYAITGQTGSGLVTINGGTGVLANYVAGDQVTIQYTTPAGGCQNTSSQVVNVTNLDDASFATADFCVSSVNAISSVITAGGTYSITGQTGSGLVTINGATGVLANYVAGDQVTIQYTTPGGGCQNSSSLVVNVTPLDDASFTTVDFCISSVNTISAVGLPGGTYSITGQTGSGLATINAGTGVLANYVAGDQVTIQYSTPAGGCQNTSTQVVNVLTLDDASFTTIDFCVSTVNTISAVASPGGTYVITGQTGSGLATINGGTGVLANYVAGDQVTIEYTTAVGGCQNTSTQVVNVTPLDDASFTTIDFCFSAVNVVSAVALPGGSYAITGQTGSGLATINAGTGVLANYVAGDQVTIEYTTPAGGCQNTSTQVVNVTPLDDASFTSVDFCESSVNLISGVATPGGTYVITGQTGSGLVTINGGTGVLANYVSGDQVTIEYTTPAGGCQNTSTQVVNITPLDDASFTSVDFCISTVNTVSAVATPGGAYVITGQTGSGLATINGGTGVLANYVAGDQITIEYTTPGGACQNTSTQVVNVTPLDDATFVSSDFCASSVNTISGVVTAGGTYTITGQTGSGLATINGGTGVLANYVAGDQVTIEYSTPAGGCTNTSTQVVNVTPLDDASFTTADFCASIVNVISAVATPGGTYAITGQTGSGLVTINGATGVLANYVAGDQVTIEYTTTGACPNTSTQVVNVTALDDASFTTADFCISTVNAISAVSTPGGTYVITGQTGSGLATINAGTGVLANYVAGDQVTIEYTTPAGGCQNASTQVVNVTPLDDATFVSTDFCASAVNTIGSVATPGGTYTITGQTGSGLATINGATGILANYVAGDQITIEYTTPAGGCTNTYTQVVNVTPLDDASFTTSDFCEASVNAISGVALPGGTYTITGQTGSGLVTINGGTGVLANYVAGDQITIEYTTPAGGCQNTSTQVVNVTAQDDASFTSVDFCESSVNAISAVAVPGGTYVITIQTGAATIDGATGVLSGYAAGDQITIEYTTPVGACQNSSTQVVNVVPSDDGTFTLTATCEGATANLTGLAGGVFSFLNAPADGAVIDPVTGTVSGGTNGTSYDVEYTTSGLCPATTSQSVVALAADDASFTLTSTCDGATAAVLGTTGGVFGFSIAAPDGAVIDASTGDVTGGDANSSYAIVYNTIGACPASSIENVIVDDCSVPITIVIPTAFTPGVDGLNGTWEIQDLDNNYPNNSVIVYNRWGSVVFEYTSSPASPYSLNRWDGTFKGQQLPVASYYYIITGNDGSDDSFKGTVTIVRN